MRTFITTKKNTRKLNANRLFEFSFFTFQVRVRSNDIELETRQDARNKPAPVSTPNACNAHTYDTADKSTLAIHQQKNDYHPKERDNATVETFLGFQRANRDKNRTQSDV